MVHKEIFNSIVFLGSWIACCSGECLETAQIVYDEEANYDYYDNQQQTGRVISISVQCSSVDLSHGPFHSRDPKNYRCSQCPQQLTVKDSIIPTIPPQSFFYYSSTTILDMKNNKIEKILPEAFDSLTSLQELYLSDNNISNILEGVFKSLANLKTLDLSNNSIKNISSQSFDGCVNLSYINLSLNALQYFDINSLMGIQKLFELDLSFNKLETFNFTSVSHNIHKMVLSNNRISHIYGCFASPLVLEIKNNSLSSLGSDTCTLNSSRIFYLDASHNSLSRLETTPALRSLMSLFLQNNHIKFIPNDYFSKLNGLILLNLSTNELEKLQYGLFDGLTKLQELHLSKNQLTSFKLYNYHLLQNIQTLYLHDNEISIFDSKNVKDILTQLQELSLDGNNFTCDTLIDIFHDLKGIKVFPGTSFNTSNIHGIACSEIDYSLEVTTKKSADTDKTFRTKLMKILNIDFTNSSLYNNFNEDFRKSSFYKYLENLLGESIFVKDLEKKLNDTNIQEIQSYTVNNFFNFGFRNSNFVRYFEQFKGFENNTSDKIALYNYFNNDFLNSSLYKKLETFENQEFEINYTNHESDAKMERLINAFAEAEEKGDKSILLLIIIFVLVITSCAMLYIMYVSYMKFECILRAKKILVIRLL